MKVLFVCTGNVCRSPLAEGYLKVLLKQNEITDVEVESAGVAALAGAPPFECAIDVAREYSFDISKKIAMQITPEMAQESDRIFCMETWQAKAVLQLDPRLVGKVALLGSYHPDGQKLYQIPDPAEFDFPETYRTFQEIKASVEAYVDSLRNRRGAV